MSELAGKLKDAGVVYREPVLLRGGGTSEFYLDIKKACGNPELLGLMADEIAKLVGLHATCLAASGYGGLPLGTAVSLKTGLPLAMVRDTEKNHGKGGLIDGHLPDENDLITLIDDVFTSGNSLSMTAETIHAAGARVVEVVVVCKRGNTKMPFMVKYLFEAAELLDN